MSEVLNREVWRQFVMIAKPYWISSRKKQAYRLLAALLSLRVALTLVNVGIGVVAGYFMTAYQGKNVHDFYVYMGLYFSVFVIGTPVLTYFLYVNNLMALRWREWLSEHLIDKYLQGRAFYHVKDSGAVDNPDERIAQTVKDFTSTALTIMNVIMRCIVVLSCFGLMLWHISPKLMMIVFAYSLVGTIVTQGLGRYIFVLKAGQLKKEATFRFSLTHVSNNGESIAFYQGEEQELKTVKERFVDAIFNFNILLGWQRNVGFLTTAYGNFVVLIPFLVIAPQYFAGQVAFGTLASAAIAFGQISQALSSFVQQFDNFTDFAAQIGRLGSFVTEIDKAHKLDATGLAGSTGPKVELENVTLTTPSGVRTILKDLSLTIQPGTSMLVVGPSGSGKSSLLRFFGGLWKSASGKVSGPELHDVLFLPQKPYMTIGTLRDQMIYPSACMKVSEEQLREVLKLVNLGDLIDRVGGLKAELNYGDVLSLGEQQRLAFARAILTGRKFLVLDESTSALDVDNQDKLYKLLRSQGSTYISVGHRPSIVQYHDQVLELLGEGEWRIMPRDEYMRTHELTMRSELPAEERR